ncbi:hypothetical protein CPLU01_06311 [Colletotrichum plurivorum]|uniref:Heterokaryon incompatibility domain-containing protein n=1 Tax=Colletotrichum plurivorum TaxID=2175906 RepID=A0A8H6KIH6_9PEZI|nr:hypothetical protein CPLU01_06311 [Colletotrichum plurivorum]
MADAARDDDSVDRPRRQRRGLLPPGLVELIGPPLKVGALTGSVGLFTGVAAGIVRDSTPALFGLASGIQWFALGSSYWFSRTVVMSAWGGESQLTNGSKVHASALAGGTAGMVGGLIRGPKNIVPGVIVFSMVGAVGQAVVNATQGSPTDVKQEKKSIFESSWSPLKKLTDDEYRDMIDEKMLKIDVEIALVDDKIAELRASKVAEAQQSQEPEPQSVEEVFDSSRRPPYAILSHTWGRDEVNFQEWEQLQEGDADTRARIQAKRGFKKIEDACRIARGDEPDYLWVDTNCIDKKSSAELSEAINSMFHWYETASCCIVYLEDVSIRLVGPGMDHLPNSRWFSRGWTLQELLAPPWAENVLFYNDKWERIGSRSSLCKDLSTLTGISEFILLDSPRYRDCSVAQRMSWASRRETTRVEDTAYCLLGLFDINMPLLYGEKDRAFRRLQEEIMKVSTDQTLFAWDCNRMPYDMDGHHAISILAPDPSYFRECSCVVQASNIGNNSEITLTNVGLTMTLPLVRTHDDQAVYAALGSRHENDFKTRFCVPLTTLADDSDNAHSNTVFTRNPYYLPSLLSIKTTRIPEQPVKICIPRMSHGKRLRWESWRIADIPNSRVLLQLFPANDALSDWEVKSWFELTTLWNVPFPKSRSVAKGCYLERKTPQEQIETRGGPLVDAGHHVVKQLHPNPRELPKDVTLEPLRRSIPDGGGSALCERGFMQQSGL